MKTSDKLKSIKKRVQDYLGATHTKEIKAKYPKLDLRLKASWEHIISIEVNKVVPKVSYDKRVYLLYSGGIGSALAAYILKHSGADFSLYFNDTKSEDPDLYRFLEETKYFFNVPFIEDSDGRTIWEVFEDSHYMGNTRADVCSRILKRERGLSFRKSLDANEVIFANGIDIWEEHRLQKASEQWLPFELRSPLIDAQVFDKETLWKVFYLETGIDKPYLYNIGMTHNNCGGFCVKAGLAHYRQLLGADRDRYMYFENKELETYEKIGKQYPFLRKTIKGKVTYITLREYREQLENGAVLSDDDQYQFGGCVSCGL